MAWKFVSGSPPRYFLMFKNQFKFRIRTPGYSSFEIEFSDRHHFFLYDQNCSEIIHLISFFLKFSMQLFVIETWMLYRCTMVLVLPDVLKRHSCSSNTQARMSYLSSNSLFSCSFLMIQIDLKDREELPKMTSSRSLRLGSFCIDKILNR